MPSPISFAVQDSISPGKFGFSHWYPPTSTHSFHFLDENGPLVSPTPIQYHPQLAPNSQQPPCRT